MRHAPCRSCVSLYTSYPYANATTAIQSAPQLKAFDILFVMTHAVNGDTVHSLADVKARLAEAKGRGEAAALLRSLAPLLQEEGMLWLAGGLPSPLAFPIEQVHLTLKHGVQVDITEPATIAKSQQYMLDSGGWGYAPLLEWLRAHVADGERVVDLCCGVGTSTCDVGVDTSPQMIAMARFLAKNRTFHVGNAETWGDDDECDVCTVMFAFHEMPSAGRRAVLSNAMRLARGKVVVVDIAETYRPSATMRSGEPFVDDYLARMRSELYEAAKDGGWRVGVDETPLPTVRLWVLRPNA